MTSETTCRPPYRQFAEYLPADNPTFGNPTFDAAPQRVLIARLSPFQDVDRSLPHLFLFQEVRRALPEAYIDLAFFPTAHARAAFDACRPIAPYLVGTQSLRGAADFDAVLISNAYTLELINLPYLFLHSGIPLLAGERGPEWPPIVLGGSNAMAAQAVIRMVDGIFFGEGEGLAGPLAAILCARPKEQALARAAAEVPGFWTAGTPGRVTRAACDPQARHLAVEYPLLNTPAVRSASLQINYGCPAFCSFCFEGYDRKPYRELPLPDLLAAARRLQRAQGAQEVDLYSFNFNTYREIMPLLLELHRLFYRVGFLSQRADILQQVPGLLEAEVAADKRSFTVGVEGISARQRAWLHKSLPTADLLGLLDRLLAARIREVKLFFLLTGHEDEADIADFRDLLRQIKAIRRARNPGIRVIFSFGLLIRMPFTPLRYDRLYLDEAHWRPLIGLCKSACETNGFEFRLAFDWPAYCTAQVLAMGGCWLQDPVIELAREGYLFDAELPAEYWPRLQARLAAAGRLDARFLGAKGPDYPFALDMVESAVPAAFLYHQYQAAAAGIDEGYCLGTQDERGRCLGCGACVEPAQREAITQHRLSQPHQGPYLAALQQAVSHKQRQRPRYYVLQVGPVQAGLHSEWLDAWVMQRLFACCPDLEGQLLAVQESLFAAPPPKGIKRGRFPAMGGESVFALYAWDPAALDQILACAPGGTAHCTPALAPRPAEGFTPGLFSRLRLDLFLPAAPFPGARVQLDRYLQAAYVPYSLQREGEGAYRVLVSDKGAKKKVLYGGRIESDETGLRAALEIGPRFDLLALVEQFGPLYNLPYLEAQVSAIAW